MSYMSQNFPAVYIRCMCQSFRLFHVSYLSILNFRFFLFMYPGSAKGRCNRPSPDWPPTDLDSGQWTLDSGHASALGFRVWREGVEVVAYL